MVQSKRKCHSWLEMKYKASALISKQEFALRESVLCMVKLRHKMMLAPLCKLLSAITTVPGKYRACSAGTMQLGPPSAASEVVEV